MGFDGPRGKFVDNTKQNSHHLSESREKGEKESKALGELFKLLDKDDSGKIEVSDLQEGLQALGLPNHSDEYVDLLLKQYHAGDQKEIDFEAFKQYITDKEQKIAASFHHIDLDNNGAISVQDLERSMKRKWLPVDTENAGRMIHLLDKDKDGVVNLEEFKAFAALLPEKQVSDNGILDSWLDSSEWAEGVEYNLASVPPKPSLNRVLASGVAGGLSKSVVAPIDRLRIMMMADRQNFSIYKTALKMWKDGGYLGLFRGNLATVLKIVPQTATQFAVYDRVQAAMVAKLPADYKPEGARLTTTQYAIAGGLAGAASSLVSYPLETVRTHMSVCARLPMYTIIKEIGSTAGLKGYYRGIQASMTNSIVSNALGFAAYEAATDAYRRYTGNSDPSFGVKGFCAGLSAIAIMTVVMPLENVERRLQVQGRDNYPVVYHGSWDCAARMYKAEGLQAFWRGALCSFSKVAPSLAVVRAVYELGMRFHTDEGTRRFRHDSVQ